MSDVRAGMEVFASLPVNDTVDVLIAPALQHDNVLMSSLPYLYKIFTGVKNKKKMNHLNKPGSALQPRTSCKNWTPSLSVDLRTTELTVCSFELMAEQCADDFDAGCLRNLEAAGDLMVDMTASEPLDALQKAALLLAKEAIVDDIYEIAWFGDEDFNDGDDIWHSNFGDIDVEQAEHMRKKIRHCNGWWREIAQRTTETDPQEKVRYVDSNDGTAGLNATNPANIQAFLRKMIKQSSPLLRNWKKNRTLAQRPVFLLQSNLYQAYLASLRAQGCTESAFQLTVNGTPVEGVYQFDGYLVVECTDWDMFDDKIGATDLNARALLIAQENLCIGIDADNVAAYANKGIVVQKSPILKDKGMIYMYAALKLGARIAYPTLVTAAWNSSTIFV